MSALGLMLLSVAAAADLGPRADWKRLSAYDFDASRTLEQRIAPMPAELLEEWQRADQAPSYSPHALSAAEKAEFLAALGALPPRLKQVLKDRVIAFYFISDLQGNGITDWVLDEHQTTYVYMVLNPAGFQKSLSELLTGREGSVFKNAGARRARLEADLREVSRAGTGAGVRAPAYAAGDDG